MLNVDELQEKHLGEEPSNAQYASRFRASALLEAIEIWLKKLMCCFKGVTNVLS